MMMYHIPSSINQGSISTQNIHFLYLKVLNQWKSSIDAKSKTWGIHILVLGSSILIPFLIQQREALGKMRVILGLFYIFVSKSFGLREIPERARGGSAYQKFVQTQSSITNKYIPKIWQAKVDNFDDLNNHTYSQRYYVDDTYWLPGKGSKIIC